MNHKRIYYSCCTSLSYFICERYYGMRHYVWCTPYFDPSSRMSQNNCVPTTSNPRDIYWNLRKEVDGGDLHSLKISRNRMKIQHGADAKLATGVIDAKAHKEILKIVMLAQLQEFKPLLLVIPGLPVSRLLKPVNVWERASVLSEEFIIESLPRKLFDAIEL
ncbi:MAG TPA: hypothetical protein VN089_18495 [Duganella sp.]|nr:hypothetical protein [Duganella sp.]